MPNTTDPIMGSIYKITSPDGKVYIGQTRNDPKKRWSRHLTNARRLKYNLDNGFNNCKDIYNSYLYRSMIKHGIDNFVFEVIETDIPVDLLNEKEIAVIAQYNSIAPNGLNLRPGGDGSNHHEQTKKLIREKCKERAHLVIDKRRRNETKGLPMYIVYLSRGKHIGYAIDCHPQCAYKSFTTAKYGDIEECKKAAIEFLDEIVKSGTVYVGNRKHKGKINPELPVGITRSGTGFLAKRKINGVIYQKVFGGKNIPEDEKLQKAIQYLNTLVKEEGSETKRLSAHTIVCA